MYNPPQFREDRPEVLAEIIRAARLALLVSAATDGGVPEATHLPMTLVPEEGPHGTLYGHVAKANPQWRGLAAAGAARAIFTGPEAYVSPSLYPSKQEHGRVVPTWNYVAVHAIGPVEVVEDAARLHAIVSRLTERHEAPRAAPWAVTDAPDDFVAGAVEGHRRHRAAHRDADRQAQAQPEPRRAGPRGRARRPVRQRGTGRPRGGGGDARLRQAAERGLPLSGLAPHPRPGAFGNRHVATTAIGTRRYRGARSSIASPASVTRPAGDVGRPQRLAQQRPADQRRHRWRQQLQRGGGGRRQPPQQHEIQRIAAQPDDQDRPGQRRHARSSPAPSPATVPAPGRRARPPAAATAVWPEIRRPGVEPPARRGEGQQPARLEQRAGQRQRDAPRPRQRASPDAARGRPSIATPTQPNARPGPGLTARRRPNTSRSPSATNSGAVADSSATSPEGISAEAAQAQPR